MRKVVTPREMQELEQQALQAGITPKMLMEEAGKNIAQMVAFIIQQHKLSKQVTLLCGPGNNAGDAYVAGAFLLQSGHTVIAIEAKPAQSELTKEQKMRFEKTKGKVFPYSPTVLQTIKEGVIIDGIFGTGIRGPLDALTEEVIRKANALRLPTVAVDIPSGLDGLTGKPLSAVIQATVTIAIEFPKVGCFIGEGWNFIGNIVAAQVGLARFAEKMQPPFVLLEEQQAAALLPEIKRTRNKYSAGHVVGIGGRAGMSGASLMASLAALRSGAGIVHLLHEAQAADAFAAGALEVVKVPYHSITEITGWLQKAQTLFIGPGLGATKERDALMTAVRDSFTGVAVIDADALEWIHGASAKELLRRSILTPHTGEAKKMLGIDMQPGSIAFLNAVKEFAIKNETHVVLKGAPSFLFSPKGPIMIMPRGDAGMATAGSGDVLTGMLAAFLAQGLSPYDAMRIGTYLHAVAGEMAAAVETSYCMTASSIMHTLPQAFTELIRFRNIASVSTS